MEIFNLPKFLDIGCGVHPRDGYIHLDIQKLDHVEYVQDARKLPFKDCELDGVYSSNTLEHFGWRETSTVLKEWIRVIKIGGTIELKLPCQKSVSRAYYEGRIDAKAFANATYADQDDETNFHKSAFDIRYVNELFTELGVINIVVEEEYRDEFGELTGFLIIGEKSENEIPKKS